MIGNSAERIYCLLLLQIQGEAREGEPVPCQVGMVVINETSPQLAHWQVRARYPGAKVLLTLDITGVVARRETVVSGLAPVVVDGQSLLNLQLQRVDTGAVVA
jgi:hypothetical protein